MFIPHNSVDFIRFGNFSINELAYNQGKRQRQICENPETRSYGPSLAPRRLIPALYAKRIRLSMSNDPRKNYLREIILTLVIIGSFIVMMSLAPISQTQAYHDFADQRTVFNIPNISNVTTNLAFTLFGIIGFNFCLKNRQKRAPWSWLIFFSGVTIVFVGSCASCHRNLLI